MVLRPCARTPKQHAWGNDAMFFHSKIKINKKYYMSAINNIKY